MNVRIEKKDAFTLFGVEKLIHLTDGINYIEVPKFWSEFYESGMCDKLYKAPNEYYHAVMGYEYTEGESMMYMIGSIKKEGIDTTGFREVEVPEAEWAIFSTEKVKFGTVKDPLQVVWKRIFTEWFPISGYEHAPIPECEFYYPCEDDMEYAEVWIPIMKPAK